jgi:hypothetical protein
MTGKSYRIHLEDNSYLDISIYPSEWTTTINMSLWKEGNGIALGVANRTYFNFEKVMSEKLAERLGTYLINKQSQQAAHINII